MKIKKEFINKVWKERVFLPGRKNTGKDTAVRCAIQVCAAVRVVLRVISGKVRSHDL